MHKIEFCGFTLWLLRLLGLILYNLWSCKHVVHQLRVLQMDYFIIKATSPSLAITTSMGKWFPFFGLQVQCKRETQSNDLFAYISVFHWQSDSCWLRRYLSQIGHVINSSTHIHTAEKWLTMKVISWNNFQLKYFFSAFLSVGGHDGTCLVCLFIKCRLHSNRNQIWLILFVDYWGM